MLRELSGVGLHKGSKVSGRKRRVVLDKNGKKIEEKRSRTIADADADAFMNDKKKILDDIDKFFKNDVGGEQK